VKTVLFGAFDRHNLGDILLAKVAAREELVGVTFAGLVARDMTPFGGPVVRTIDEALGREPVRLIHVGGELLDCDSTQAAFMLQESAVAVRRQCAYVIAKHDLPAGSSVEFRAVGGVALGERPVSFRIEVLNALSQADAVSVRDAVTCDFLAANGIEATLACDPVTRIAELFRDEIRSRRPAMTDFLAMQFAAEWGDDATLNTLARGIERIDRPVVLFRAGAAPWHDDLEPYRRLASRLKAPATIFESLNVRDICGLIASAARVVATSLHVRIVADAFGVPVTSLEQRQGSARKLGAYLATWQPEALPVCLDAFAAGA
jgi:hypothetical protein